MGFALLINCAVAVAAARDVLPLADPTIMPYQTSRLAALLFYPQPSYNSFVLVGQSIKGTKTKGRALLILLFN